jgi:hypothetical protein
MVANDQVKELGERYVVEILEIKRRYDKITQDLVAKCEVDIKALDVPTYNKPHRKLLIKYNEDMDDILQKLHAEISAAALKFNNAATEIEKKVGARHVN